MGGNQSQPNATAIIGTGKGGPLDTSAGTIASRGISFTYDHAAEPALRDITLTVPAGECIVLCGASGCGKTSYTRVANGLIPSFFHGAFAGNQTTCGLDVETVPIDRLTPLVGSVFQNPKTQYFNANVTDELAFPAENIGLPAEDINRRITAVAERFGIGHLLHRSIFHLSGGQKQRIAVAAATMLGPRLVVLDEPTSNLDANAIADMRAMIEQMKDEGLTIVIAEHRLAWLNGVADRYVVFDGGHIVQDYEADEFLSLSPGCVAAMGLRALDLQPYRRRIAALASSPAADECTSVLLGTHNLTIGYKGKDGFTRAIPDLRFRAGEITGLMGNNGCGKTTLVRTLTGLIKPVSGRIELNGVPAKPRDLTRAGFLVMQDVNYQLFSDSVREELLIGLDETDAGITAQANQVMADLDLAAFVERHPMSLSGGQKQRVAIGSALMCGKDLIIFDEPTSSLTPTEVARLFEVMRGLTAEGKGLVFVSHRLEEIFSITDKITVLRDGVNICESVPTASLNQAELIRLMIGRELGDVFHQRQRPAADSAGNADAPAGDVVLEVERLAAPPLVKDVSFALHRGEILGLAGLVGAGRTQTARVLFGLKRPSGGSIKIMGKPYQPKCPADAYACGLAMIPEDRKNQGIIPDFLVRENIKLSHMSVKSRVLTGYGALFDKVLNLTDLLKLPRTHLDKGILQLSGGQQQKALISRVLLMDPGILIVDEPTQGVDIGTRSDIYEILKGLADKGFSILFISSDFEEILGVCDRIVVLTEGRVAADVPAHLLDEEKLTMFAAPRTSAENTHRMLVDLTGRFADAAAYWIYVDRGSVYCFNLREGQRAPGLGFAAGQVIPLEQTCLAGFEPSDQAQEVSGRDLVSLLAPIHNHRGQNMGYIGISVPTALRPENASNEVSSLIEQLMN